MKKHIVYKLFFTCLILLGIMSCDDRENLVVESTNTPIVMDLSKDNLLLDENFPANPALTITWKAAEYNYPVEIKYDLEISSTEKFDAPYMLTSTIQSQTYASFTNKELNEAAKKIGLVPYVEQKMYFRITSHIGSNADLVQRSNITGLSVTPYVARPTYEYDELYLIGNAAIGNWDNNANNNTLIPLLKTSNASQYTYTGLFKAGADLGFKMIRVKGSWDAQFGLGATTGQLSTSGGSGNITVPSEGYYKLNVDTAALTYTLVKIDDPVTAYGTISLYGTATESTDKQLTKSTYDPHLWTAFGVSLKEGVVKFRANNSWDVNWGTNSEYFGVGTAGGADIPVSAEWTYDVYFNDISGNYTLIPTE